MFYKSYQNKSGQQCLSTNSDIPDIWWMANFVFIEDLNRIIYRIVLAWFLHHLQHHLIECVSNRFHLGFAQDHSSIILDMVWASFIASFHTVQKCTSCIHLGFAQHHSSVVIATIQQSTCSTSTVIDQFAQHHSSMILASFIEWADFRCCNL